MSPDRWPMASIHWQIHLEGPGCHTAGVCVSTRGTPRGVPAQTRNRPRRSRPPGQIPPNPRPPPAAPRPRGTYVSSDSMASPRAAPPWMDSMAVE